MTKRKLLSMLGAASVVVSVPMIAASCSSESKKKDTIAKLESLKARLTKLAGNDGTANTYIQALDIQIQQIKEISADKVDWDATNKQLESVEALVQALEKAASGSSTTN